MAHERNGIDGDGIERIGTKLSREECFGWGGYSLLGFGGVFFIVLLVWGGMMLIGSDPDRTVNAAPVSDDGLVARILSA